MPSPQKIPPLEKKGWHPRSRHGSRYDFPALIKTSPELARWIVPHPAGGETVDFFDPAAVKALNQALLRHDYGIDQWDIPPGYLCPPIPGRADYLHHVADLLAESNRGKIPRGSAVVVLDIGVGANAIYPLIGAAEYGWQFVGTEIDPLAVSWAIGLVARNSSLAGKVEIRRQTSADRIFSGVTKPGETFALSLCNPPFHASATEAAEGTIRKLRNLAGITTVRPVLNFGGQGAELWCPGGEIRFVQQMIKESADQPTRCTWSTTLVSKQGNLPAFRRALESAKAQEIRVLELAHGQKKSRILAWTFLSSAARASRALPQA